MHTLARVIISTLAIVWRRYDMRTFRLVNIKAGITLSCLILGSPSHGQSSAPGGFHAIRSQLPNGSAITKAVSEVKDLGTFNTALAVAQDAQTRVYAAFTEASSLHGAMAADCKKISDQDIVDLAEIAKIAEQLQSAS